MRVLMTADAVGGVWQYALQLASLLAGRHVQVILATMGPEPSATQQSEALAIPGLSLRTSSFALEWMPNPWADVNRAAEWLLRLEADFSPDVVHLNGFAHANLPWRTPVLVVAHSCVSSWSEAVTGERPSAEWHEYVQRVSDGLAAATAVVAPTQAMAEALTRHYLVNRAVTVIANCRDGTIWSPQTKEPLVFAAGRVWDPAKNLLALDDVSRHIEWPVYVAGDNRINGGGGALQHAHELGRLSSAAMASWMGRASIYALPARYEPFGLSVLEAALSGCALVLGDIPSLRENWSGVARFVQPDRPGELRDTLQALIAHGDERHALADAARRRAQVFSPAAHVAAYARLYGEMVTTHGRLADTARAL